MKRCCFRRRAHSKPQEYEQTIIPPLIMHYPMCVVSVDSFLDMFDAQPHQVLKSRGTVVEIPDDADWTATFVSHQWCGAQHADPQFAQLRVLQSVLRKAVEGTLPIDVDLFRAIGFGDRPTFGDQNVRRLVGGYLWYDFFSVPQPGSRSSLYLDIAESLGKAVASLPAYVERARFFLVLAPTVAHESGQVLDYHSWKGRGWCRFERLARVLSCSEEKIMLVVQHEGRVVQVGPHEYLFDPVGEGEFSHDADRRLLAPRSTQILERRLNRLLREGNLAEYRRLMAQRQCLLGDVCTSWRAVNPQAAIPHEPTGALDVFLEEFRLKSPVAKVDGMRPLTLAVLLGDVCAMRSLIDCRAQIERRETRHQPALHLYKGMRPAHIAMAHGHVGALQLLLECRASVNERDHGGQSVVAFYCKDRPELVQLLVDHRADINSRNWLGMTPLHCAAFQSRPRGVEAMLAVGATVTPNRDGLVALHVAGMFGGSVDTTICLIDAGMALEARVSPRRWGALWAVLTLFSLAYRLGSRRFLHVFGHHFFGATPLMLATMAGNADHAQAMLSRGANAEARNARGLNTAELRDLFRSLCAAGREPSHQ